MTHIDQTIAERTAIYGDPELCLSNIGLAWTGLLQNHYGTRLDHPVPAFLVAQMMAALKLVRATRVYHADNYTDLAAFAKFANQFQTNESKGGTE